MNQWLTDASPGARLKESKRKRKGKAMPQITKPMLAGSYDATKAQFPYAVTPKIDGIRFVMVNGVALSRSFKPIRNVFIQSLLSKYLPDGIDGELTCGTTFQSSSSAIMSSDGEPEFCCWIFDYVDPSIAAIEPYLRRIGHPGLVELEEEPPFQLTVLRPENVASEEELRSIEEACLEAGFEGVMVRDPNGTYKFGRSTAKENILLKVKRFVDDEATIIDILEKQHNTNEALQDAFGRTKRSTSQDGMVGADTAGTLVVQNSDGIEFGIGTGLDDALRAEIWANKEQYIGKIVKYKSFQIGVKEKPRHPVFLGFRHSDDL
jgi:DNA ligase-1